MFKKLENKKGVTLVELLAVVVIMGIVAAIAVPTIGGLITRQQANADEATFLQIEEAARLYAVDDADGVFTLTDMIDGIDLRANVVKVDADGAGAGAAVTLAPVSGSNLVTGGLTYSNLEITVTGSVVTFRYDADGVWTAGAVADGTLDILINNTIVH